MFAGWQFSPPDAIQLAAYSVCALGLALNALPSNCTDSAAVLRDSCWVGARSRDNNAPSVMTSFYQRARRATSFALSQPS